MLNFLTENPAILFIGNCCLMPLLFVGLGAWIGRYRPRLRMPFTVDRMDEMDMEDF